MWLNHTCCGPSTFAFIEHAWNFLPPAPHRSKLLSYKCVFVFVFVFNRFLSSEGLSLFLCFLLVGVFYCLFRGQRFWFWWVCLQINLRLGSPEFVRTPIADNEKTWCVLFVSHRAVDRTDDNPVVTKGVSGSVESTFCRSKATKVAVCHLDGKNKPPLNKSLRLGGFCWLSP